MPPHAALAPAVICLHLLLLSNLVCDARPCKHPPPKARHHRRPPPRRAPAGAVTLTVFGDSLSDNGQNEFPRTNFSVPDPTFYDRGRCSNGPVWNELIGKVSLGKIGRVYNYAYSDAVACSENQLMMPEWPESVWPLPLDKQTDKYLAERKAGAAAAGARNIVVLFIGSNDLLQVFYSSNATAAGMALLQCITANVVKLAQAGETRIAVLDFPPLELSPFATAMLPKAVLPFLSNAVKTVNAALKLALGAVQAQLPKTTTVSYIDANNFTMALYQAAVARGIVTNVSCLTTRPPNNSPLYGRLNPNVTTLQCASRGAGYFFYDWSHPTTETHTGVARALDERFRALHLY